LLVRRTRELQRHLPAAIEGNDTSVHQARVASRRLREAVPVLATGLKRGRKAQRKIQRVTQALGTVREMDVTMQILDELARRPQIPRNALEDVRAHVIAERDRRRAIMIDRLRQVNTPKLSRRLEEVALELAAASGTEWRTVLASRLELRAKRFVAAIHAAGQMYAPDRLHDVRIATKKLRYALELASDARVAGARKLVATLKRTQEALGRLNDLHVIQRHVADVQAHPPARRGATDGGLDVIARSLEEECRHLHARYTKQIPSLLELAETCRTSTLGQLNGTRPRPLPLKMTGAGARRAVARRA
jgi:CHAD domain-containing protein